MISIRRLLVREFLIVGTLALLLLLGTRGLAEFWTIRAQATTQAGQSFELLKDGINHHTQDAETLGQSLALLWRRGALAPGQPGTELALEALLRQSSAQNLILVDTLGDLASAHFIDGTYRTRSLVRVDGLMRIQEREWNEAGQVAQSRLLDLPAPDYTQRPWYRQAVDTHTPSWTLPYLFVSPPLPGVTYCLPVKDAQGKVLGAVGVDLRLQELDQLIGKYKPTPGARSFITTPEGKAIASGNPDAAGAGPLQEAALAQADADSEWPMVNAEGRRWLVHRDRLDGSGWMIVAAIPVGDLISMPRRITLSALAIGFATILAIALRLMAVSRRLTVPLMELAVASEGLLAEHPVPLAPTDIHELALAREALAAASTSLRERQRLEAELQRIQRLELVGNMASGLAHDMNNHLAAIQGQVELAGLKAPEGPAAPYIARALDACGRMGRLLQDLVAFGRPRQIAMERVDLNALLWQTGRLLEHSRGKPMQVEFDLDPAGPVVLGDRVQLEQVILNLGFNAKDASPERGRITLMTRHRDGEACFEISDSGTGMTPEVREKLFTPFFSTKGAGGGTGLGLAMVASIVKAHGGRITVESEPGFGSIFTVWLPLASPEPA